MKAGIRTRVLFVALVPAAILAVSLGLYFIGLEYQQRGQVFLERGAALARHLAPASEYGVSTGNSELLETLVQATLDDPDVSVIRIEDVDGRVLVDASHLSRESVAEESSTLGSGAQAGETAPGDVLIFREPIYQTQVLLDTQDGMSDEPVGSVSYQRTDRVLGWVEVQLSTASMLANQKRALWRSVTITLVILGLTGLLAGRIGRQVTAPVIRLTRAVKDLEKGRLDTRVPVQSSGELASLESGINAMATALRKAHDDLEGQVRTRTTELRQANEALRNSQARLDEAQRIAQLGNWEWHIAENRLSWSDEAYRIFGLDPAVVAPNYETLLQCVHPDDRPTVRQAIEQALVDGQSISLDYHLIRDDGTERSIHLDGVIVTDSKGVPVRMVGTVQDVTERKQTEVKLAFMAYHDPLTELPNRILLRKRLKTALQKCGEGGELVGVLFLDLDNFKTVNDSLGHEAGDQLLMQVTERLKSGVRKHDTLARLGGDEFTVVLEELWDAADAANVADHLLNTLTSPFNLNGAEVYVTTSIGISVFPYDGDDPDTLMKNADIAMYQAKAVGRNTYRFFSREMSAQAEQRLMLETELRRAIQNQEFVLYYQPLVDIENGRTIAAEALIRWRHPEYGLIEPGRFIPLAEEAGLIAPIGAWVFREAAGQLRVWQDAGLSPVRVMVNLSAKQFLQDDLVARLEDVTRAAGVGMDLFGLEITESAIMEKTEMVAQVLERLKRRGAHVAIDDFGTGHSSLSNLKRLPVDAIKIDRSFVRDIVTDADDAAIVQATVAMAQALGIDVVAEGVEQPEQLELLRSYDCRLLQGYLFSKPQPADKFAELLRDVAVPVSA